MIDHGLAMKGPVMREIRLIVASATAFALWLGAGAAGAQPAAALFTGADLGLGERLIRENRCVQCHQSKVGGDGSSIYRPAGRVNTPGALRGMVEQCNTELNLQLFPDEVTAVSAVLNRDHYRFK
jgi:mono/diheme cytochrome c family protein